MVLSICGLAGLHAFAQEGALESAPPKDTTPDEIIKHFAAKEKEFKEAREHYTFRQDIKVMTLDGETVTGEYREVFDVTYDDKGKHLENVVFAPQSTLEHGGLSLDQGDLKDFRNRLPFVLTSDEVGEYNILYVGQQQEDELHCYVFDVAPKKIEYAKTLELQKRYFQGRLWVDDHDFQIVKTYGKTVPDLCGGHACTGSKKREDNEHLYPKFTTWRQQIDGQYWFPVFTRADDDLHFKTGDIHIREVVKYEDYRRFGSNVKILYEGKEIPKAPQQKPPEQAKPQ